METVRKYGGNLGQGRNRGGIMAEKIQRSHCSCIWELCFFLISHAKRHVRSIRRQCDGSFRDEETTRAIMSLVTRTGLVKRNEAQDHSSSLSQRWNHGVKDGYLSPILDNTWQFCIKIRLGKRSKKKWNYKKGRSPIKCQFWEWTWKI